MKIKLYKKETKIPTKSHKLDVGYDCYCLEDFAIGPFETKVLDLGFGVKVPEGYSCMLVPRSSTAKMGLISQTEIIDPGYTGEIHLILTNCSNQIYRFKKDQRLVSLVFYKVLPDESFEIVEDLGKSERGNKGLGSSGK